MEVDIYKLYKQIIWYNSLTSWKKFMEPHTFVSPSSKLRNTQITFIGFDLEFASGLSLFAIFLSSWNCNVTPLLVLPIAKFAFGLAKHRDGRYQHVAVRESFWVSVYMWLTVVISHFRSLLLWKHVPPDGGRQLWSCQSTERLNGSRLVGVDRIE